MYCTRSSTLRSPPAPAGIRTRARASSTAAAKVAARLPPPEIASPTSRSGSASGTGAKAGVAARGRSWTLAKHPVSNSVSARPHPARRASLAAALMSSSSLRPTSRGLGIGPRPARAARRPLDLLEEEQRALEVGELALPGRGRRAAGEERAEARRGVLEGPRGVEEVRVVEHVGARVAPGEEGGQAEEPLEGGEERGVV